MKSNTEQQDNVMKRGMFTSHVKLLNHNNNIIFSIIIFICVISLRNLSFTIFKQFDIQEKKSQNRFNNSDSSTLIHEATTSIEDGLNKSFAVSANMTLDATTSTEDGLNNNFVINFHKEENIFIDKLSDCIGNRKCKVFHHHIPKTAGTTIATNMFQVFPFLKAKKGHVVLRYPRTCCNDEMLKRFYQRKDLYCKAKFTSFEVSGSQFREIISECMKLSDKNTQAIVLLPFRSPESRTLSHINQACNKNIQSRNEELRKACNDCNNAKNKKIFLDMADDTNKRFIDILETIKLSPSIPRVRHILTLEAEDVNKMFLTLRKNMPHLKFAVKNKINIAKTNNCNFGMTSDMIDKLAPSRSIYRDLVLNNF